MENKRLLECLDIEYQRLREVAGRADMTAMVPSCPDWTMADLLRHLAQTYLHKVECMRQGKNPDPWPPAGLEAEQPLALLDRGYAALVAEFAARASESGAYTWYESDQTVGFWIRRMAQETVIHRVDVELGAGQQIAPIPADLAEDGIDELLVTFVEFAVSTWPEEFAELLAGADGRAVRVATPGSAWLVRAMPTAVRISSADAAAADGQVADGHVADGAVADGAAELAVAEGINARARAAEVAAQVHGESGLLLRWLWARGGDESVSVTGDSAALARLRGILAVCTT